jgi:hypothetical protein
MEAEYQALSAKFALFDGTTNNYVPRLISLRHLIKSLLKGELNAGKRVY